MKKLLSLLLAVCMVASLFTVGMVSASAQNYDTAIIIDGTTYIATVGETFTYSVFFNYSKKLSAGQIEIPVNGSYLSYPSEAALNADIGDYMPVAADTGAAFVTVDGLIFNFATAGSYDFSSKPVVQVKFTVLKKGTIDLTPTLREVVDENGNDVIDINSNTVDASFKRSVEIDLSNQNTYKVNTPRVSSLSSTAAGIKLAWAKCDGAELYRVFRKDNGKWVKLADTTALNYVDKTVTSGVEYIYTVRCYASNAKTATSEYVRSGWRFTYIAPPALPTFENTNDGIKVKWAAVAGAEKYRVFRMNGSKWAKVGDTTGTSLVDRNVVGGTKYTYTVRCISMKGAYTSAYDTTGKTNLYIAPPVIGSVANAVGGVQVKWAQSTGAVNYRVFRKTAASGWAKVADTTAVSLLDKTAVSGTKYWYTVRCISKDAKKYTSGFDGAGKAVDYYAAPAVPTATINASSITLKWTAVPGVYNYRVFRKIGSGGWAKLGDTTDLTITDNNVTGGTKYSYTVRCLSEDSTKYISAYNTTGRVVTFVAPPAVPTVKNTKNGIVVSWKKPAGAVNYRIFRKTGTGGWAKLVDTTALTYTDKSAKNGTKYTYTIRCISSDGKSYTSYYNTKGTAITCKR